MSARIVLLLLGGSLCAAFGQLLFKLGASGRSEPAQFLNPWIFAGLALYALGTVLWIVSLSTAKLTAAYPFTVLTFVIVYALGIVVLGEAVSVRAVAGALIVLLGLGLIAVS